MENEIWKDINGYEGKYKISNLGRVLSILNNGNKRILNGTIDRDGYNNVSLRKDKARLIKKVHRLVAEAFIPNPENKPQVNHKNGIKTDNRFSELEWATSSENNLHAFKIGLRMPANLKGEKNPRYKTGINEHGAFPKVCEQCRKDFIAKIKRYRFCSRLCSQNFRIENSIIIK